MGVIHLYKNGPADQRNRKSKERLTGSLLQNARHSAEWTAFDDDDPSFFDESAWLNAYSRRENAPEVGDLLLRHNVYSVIPAYPCEHTRDVPQRRDSRSITLTEYEPWKQREFDGVRIRSLPVYSPERKEWFDSTFMQA